MKTQTFRIIEITGYAKETKTVLWDGSAPYETTDFNSADFDFGDEAEAELAKCQAWLKRVGEENEWVNMPHAYINEYSFDIEKSNDDIVDTPKAPAPKHIPNYHIITVCYQGATNTRGSRVKITSERFKQSKSIPFNHSFNNTLDIAEDWLKTNGFNVIGHGEGNDKYYVITDTFEPLKK